MAVSSKYWTTTTKRTLETILSDGFVQKYAQNLTNTTKNLIIHHFPSNSSSTSDPGQCASRRLVDVCIFFRQIQYLMYEMRKLTRSEHSRMTGPLLAAIGCHVIPIRTTVPAAPSNVTGSRISTFPHQIIPIKGKKKERKTAKFNQPSICTRFRSLRTTA